jgi:hypothetical protein
MSYQTSLEQRLPKGQTGHLCVSPLHFRMQQQHPWFLQVHTSRTLSRTQGTALGISSFPKRKCCCCHWTLLQSRGNEQGGRAGRSGQWVTLLSNSDHGHRVYVFIWDGHRHRPWRSLAKGTKFAKPEPQCHQTAGPAPPRALVLLVGKYFC